MSTMIAFGFVLIVSLFVAWWLYNWSRTEDAPDSPDDQGDSTGG
jgi:hypothetical protein